MPSNRPHSETLSDIVDEALEAAAAAEEDMTDANKADASKARVIHPNPNPVDAFYRLDAAYKRSMKLFETSEGRKFTMKEIVKAVEGSSGRAAARALGIAESTLRGWRKRIEKHNGPTIRTGQHHEVIVEFAGERPL